MSAASREKMSAARKKLWAGPGGYGDVQRAKRTALKYAQLHGAFHTNPVEEPTLDEFDRWTY